jgi:1-phosphofructokinase family hexose kinase
MILSVSPNTALDRVRVIRKFQIGRQSRALFEFLQPGGSGVHASSVIRALGGESLALGLLGGHSGELWKIEADERGLIHDMVSILNETRESFCLIDLDQGSVVENVVEGPTVARDIKDALLARLEFHLPDSELLIISGSLPPGLPIEIYSDMIELARRHHVHTLADIHSESLKMALPHKPWLIKPNLAEFHELIGHHTHSLTERVKASRDFYRETEIALALSMSEEGLLLASAEGQYLLPPPTIKMHLPDGLGQNVIGCGDALVGALAYEYCRSGDLLAAAKLGVAAAHFNLGTFGVPEIDAKQVWELSENIQIKKLSDH